ncbi:hypothetical protein Ahy_B03g068749 isoform A [Arachis hypogaea]|uniref:Uncharacterized protein n=1 Tax=Arachis hypogaea TaxID=3818 RepID=A0A445AAZ6_ARAHY|nr:hypothetical protein Ahy_B03g068749 isoform A [Arachis hypogaea]
MILVFGSFQRCIWHIIKKIPSKLNGYKGHTKIEQEMSQFQHVYTHQKFREVQAQFRGKMNCITRLMSSALGYLVYEVGEQVSNSIFNKFAVTYDSVAAK